MHIITQSLNQIRNFNVVQEAHLFTMAKTINLCMDKIEDL